MPLNIKGHPTDVPVANRWALQIEKDLRDLKNKAKNVPNVATNVIAATPSTGGGLTSVGLSMPKEFSVANSPLVSNGTIKASWLAEASGTFLGASPAGAASWPDAFSAAQSVGSSVANQITTGAAGIVFYIPQGDRTGSGTSGPSGSGWSRLTTDFTNAGIWTNTTIPANTVVSQTATYTPISAGAISSGLLSIASNGSTPAVVHYAGSSGALTNGSSMGTATTVTASMALMAIFDGDGTPSITGVYDSRGNAWYRLIDAHEINTVAVVQSYVSVWYCPNPAAGSTQAFMATTGGVLGGNAHLLTITNLGLPTNIPSFRNISFAELGGVVPVSNGGTGVSLANTGGSNQVVQQSSTGAGFTVGQLDWNQILGNNSPIRSGGASMVGAGFSTVYAKDTLTAQGGNVGNTTLSGTSGRAGLYRISVYMIVTRAATTSSTLPDSRIRYTDPDSGASIFVNATPGSSGNTTSTITQATVLINMGNGGGMTYDIGQVTPYASVGGTSMQFAYRIIAEFLG